MSESEAATRDDVVSEHRSATHDDHEVTHITLRVVDLGEDGFRVTEPDVSTTATRDDVHDAVAAYAMEVCDDE